jgi:hypothetical protein
VPAVTYGDVLARLGQALSDPTLAGAADHPAAPENENRGPHRLP